MVPHWMTELLPSDWLMFAFAVLLLFFVLDYGSGTPWWKTPVSFFVFEYGLSVLALMGLIIYGVIFDQRIGEWARVLVMFGLCLGIIGKIIVLKVSRHQGRIERRERRRLAHEATHPAASKGMTMTTPTPEQVKDATTIWYKAQRVLRTLVQVAIPAFLSFALVLPAIIEALGLPVDSELRLWLIAVAAGVTAVATAISRVMAIPAVNAWLTKIGLGSVPRSAIAVETDVLTGKRETYVMPDQKATGEK